MTGFSVAISSERRWGGGGGCRPGLALLVLALGLAACSSRHEMSEGVQLIVTPETLEPTTTFELRFEAPMVASASVGRRDALSPLEIRPPLRGAFTWLSQRSGVFTPADPPALGAAYQLRLRSGLTEADGRSCRARLERTVRTPGLQVSEPRDPGPPSEDAPVMPQFALAWNAAVQAKDAAPYVSFRSRDAGTVPAVVRQTTVKEFLGYSFGRRWTESVRGLPLTWRQRFWLGTASTLDQPPPGLPIDRTDAPDLPVAHSLTVSPAKPLPPGHGWELVVAAGVPSPETTARLAAPFVVPVGDVLPFVVTRVEPDSGLSSGRKILVHFSKPLSPEVQASNLWDWITISPTPPHLIPTLGWAGARLRGDFRLGERYEVTVRAGLPGAQPVTLAQDYRTNVTFAPLPPRLYFPGFATEQWSDGRREFPLLALNADQVEVKAKRLDAHTLVHALRGYRSYAEPQRPRSDSFEPYQALDYNLVPGRTVFAKQFLLSNRVDEAESLVLRWDDILGPGQRGPVFLAAEHVIPSTNGPVRIGTQALIQLTDLGLAWKRTPTDALVYLFSHRTGKGVADAEVELLTDESEVLASQRTDASGLARFSAPTNGEWLLAQHAGDLRAAELGRNTQPAYGFGLPWDAIGRDSPSPVRALLFSDRPVYRPSDTVHLKAIVREWQNGRLGLPRLHGARLKCFNARGQEFLQTNLTLSALGSLDHDLQLPPVSQGEYRAEVHLNGTDFTHLFLVRDYRPNAFEIHLQAQPVYAPGDDVRIGVTANYLLGQPLTRGRIEWSLSGEDDGFSPPGFEGFQFCSSVYQEELAGQRGSFASQGQGDYSSRTNFVIVPELPLNPKVPQPRKARLLVELTDLNQQSLAQRAELVRHSSDFYLGCPQFERNVRVGSPVPLVAVAVGADGQPWPEAVTARIKVQRVIWRTVRVETAGHVTGYRSEPELKPIVEQEVATARLVRRGTQWEAEPSGSGAEPVRAAEAGQYLVEARAQDAQGRSVLTAFTFHVFGKDELAWDYRNEAQLELVADAARYRAGDTATILAKAPINGEALVTVEREQVLRSYLTNLTGNAPAIRVPIEAGDAPNVFVSVLLVRGAAASLKTPKAPEYRLGFCRLEVDQPDARLQVSVRSDAADYLPGVPVGVTVEVQDARQQLVSGAEVVLFAVDEGVLSLTGFETPDPHAFFFKGEPLGVETGITLPHLLPEEPAKFAFQNKGYLIGGGGRVPPRQNFRACAFWTASLRTDARGLATASFAAPDSLTRYRVMAVAHTADSRFGRGQSDFQVNKPLMLEPALPRFALVGDRILARAVVLNRTARTGEVEVTLRLDDKAALGPAPGGGVAKTPSLTNRVAVPAQGAASLDLPIEFVRPGGADWVWTARWAGAEGGAGDGDTVRSSFNVGDATPLLREVHLARVRRGETNLLAGVNPQLLEGEGSVAVRVSASRVGALREAVSRLLHYPYGCVEQTTSSLLPWLLASDEANAWLRGTNRTEDLERAIRNGVYRLLAMQTYAGGLAYWPGGQEPMLWGSAYGGIALALAKQRGVLVPEASLEALVKYLREQLRPAEGTRPDAGVDDRCLASFALALLGKTEAAYLETLFNQRARLSGSGRAWLALAMIASQTPSDRSEELLSTRTAAATGSGDYFSSSESQLAARLLAWTRLRPQAPEVDVLTAELMQTMRDGHWGTTQGNAWALLALTEYARAVESGPAQVEGTLRNDGREERFELADRSRVFERSFGGGTNGIGSPLLLVSGSDSPLFAQVVVEARPPAGNQPRQDRGYLVDRTYQRLDDENRPQAGSGWRVGDRVLITVTLEARQAAHYVVVDDPLPCVFEPVNAEFRSQETPGAAALGTDWVSSHRELRADRAVFFCDHLAPGRYALSYLARVRAAGSVTAPPTKVEEMYHPERFGLTETLSVKASAE